LLTGFAVFFLFLAFGNVTLLLVEDLIVDECQKKEWGSVRVEAGGFSLARVFRYIFFSIFLAATGVILTLLSFIPWVAPICLILSALFVSFNFTSAFLSRIEPDNRKRTQRFLRSWFRYWVLGIILYGLLLFPLLNVFLLGYAQILATLWAMRIERFDLPRHFQR
jgi:hypothetical protein